MRKVGKPGVGANTNRRLRLLRKASTTAQNKYTISGSDRKRGKHKEPTLPKLKFLEESEH